MKLTEIKSEAAALKFVIVDDDDWEDDEEMSSMVDTYGVSMAEIEAYAQKRDVRPYDLYGDHADPDDVYDFAKDLERGAVGKKLAVKTKVRQTNPDLGVEGVKAEGNVHILFPNA